MEKEKIKTILDDRYAGENQYHVKIVYELNGILAHSKKGALEYMKDLIDREIHKPTISVKQVGRIVKAKA